MTVQCKNQNIKKKSSPLRAPVQETHPQNRIYDHYLRYRGLQKCGFPALVPHWSNPRPISDSQLHTLLCFHLCPINLIVSKGTYYLKDMGYLISGWASRLDAFSVYPVPAWLPGYAPGGAAGAPAAGPARSSRTKASSLQISCAHAG